MSFIAIGMPGGPVRSILTTTSMAVAEKQAAAGEVCLPVTSLGEYSISSDGTTLSVVAAPVTQAMLTSYASTQLQVLLGAVKSYTSGSTTINSDAVRDTLTDWMGLQQWALTNPSGTTQWLANDNSVSPLPATAIAPIGQAVAAYAQTLWQDIATVILAIGAGTITTTAQIDSALAT